MPYAHGGDLVPLLEQPEQGRAASAAYGTPITSTVSGQSTPAKNPWHDPHGFVGDKEINFLFCTDEHLKYTPFCRQFDFGTTPSEIVASAIDTYEWNYKWRNFRLYNKFWNGRLRSTASRAKNLVHRSPSLPLDLGLRLVAGRAHRELPQGRRAEPDHHPAH